MFQYTNNRTGSKPAKNQQAQVQKFAGTDQLMSAILIKLETKEKLKLKFRYILNQYI